MSNNRSWLWGIVGAVLAVFVTLGVIRIVSDNNNDVAPAAEQSTPTPTPTQASSDDSPTATTTSTFTVAAYFVGETGRGPRLFREFSKADGNDVGKAAMAAALVDGNDVDYHSPWASFQVSCTSVSLEGGTLTVDLAVADPEQFHSLPAGMDAKTASMAVEQLVRTAQGALKSGRVPVQFLVNDNHIDTLFGVPVAEPVSAAPDDKVLAHVWVNTPLDGAQVKAGDRVEGLANAFEANVTWQLKQGNTVVKDGFTTAEQAFTMSPFSFRLPAVPAGVYTLVVSEDDPSGGEGGGPDFDTKDLTFG
jgi:hypothetical protein